MGLSTHVLDTMHGRPAAGMSVEFYKGSAAAPAGRLTLDANGRAAVADTAGLARGTYRLVFDVAGYFRSRGVQLPDPPFLGRVTLDFGIADPGEHYHVPLLVSPWSYSTYRGS